jgi:predicted transcriptional regulator
MFERESYNNIIELLIEDTLKINEKTKKEIEEARKRIEKGEFFTQKEIEKEFGL